MTPEEVVALKSDLREAQQQISDLRISMAERVGAGRAAAWWGAGMAGMLLAWLGVTSMWQIPSLVTATAAGQAEQRAKAAAVAAEEASKQLQEIASKAATFVKYGDSIALKTSRGAYVGADSAAVTPRPALKTDERFEIEDPAK